LGKTNIIKKKMLLSDSVCNTKIFNQTHIVLYLTIQQKNIYNKSLFSTGEHVMVQLETFQPFLVSLILGALLGFERGFTFKTHDESEDVFAGIRTFSLIALFGCLAAFLEKNMLPGILLVSFSAIAVLTVISYFVSFYRYNDRGITTEISIFICFVIGVVVHMGHFTLATFITIIVAVMLYLKETLQNMTKRVESDDIRAVLKFALITFVVLPLFDPAFSLKLKDFEFFRLSIPDTYTALMNIELVNPHTVWLMVVLISGIGFTGYVAIKILGSRKGTGLTGFLGGLVSSTATTMTFSKRSKEEEKLSLSFSLAIILACSVMFPRVLVEVLVINARLLPTLAVPIGMMAAGGFIVSLIIWKRTENETTEEVPLKNPFNIMPAVKFGLFYAIIVLVTKLASTFAGDSGMYIVSVISGLTDVDAITLTMSQISSQDPSKLGQATVAITLAAFSNTLMKGGLAIALGSSGLKKIVIIAFGIIILSGIGGLVIVGLIQ